MSTPPFARPELSTFTTLAVPPDAKASHPFPVSQIPDLLVSRFYFVEDFKERSFLRMLSNPYFLREVNFADFKVEVPVDEQNIDQVKIKLLWVQFTPDPMTVGYAFREEIRWFVPKIAVGKSISELEEDTQRFYDSVEWESRNGIQKASNMEHVWTTLGY